jgi:hypothetical protein
MFFPLYTAGGKKQSFSFLHPAPQAQGTRDPQKRIQKNFRFSPYAKREK